MYATQTHEERHLLVRCNVLLALLGVTVALGTAVATLRTAASARGRIMVVRCGMDVVETA
jgi:hypothetical protein